MIIDYINEILVDRRNNITLERLSSILKDFNIYTEEKNLLKDSRFFSLCNGSIFVKEKFNEQKDLFFSDFDDYSKTKIIDNKVRQDIIENLKFFIPDILFVEFIDINLEEKLLVFDMFLTLIQKPRNTNNELKTFFNELIEFYSVVVIYSTLIIENYRDDYERLTKMVDKIVQYESVLKNHLFNIMTLPGVVSKKINSWVEEFHETKNQLTNIFNDFFSQSIKYSERLLKRVISKELSNFTVLSLLTRLEFSSLLDYLLVITENRKAPSRHNLFEDLGIL